MSAEWEEAFSTQMAIAQYNTVIQYQMISLLEQTTNMTTIDVYVLLDSIYFSKQLA